MKFPFEGKKDFDNESFYYFLPHFNPEKKKKIGEKITQFKGVILYFIFAIQLISFSLRENINILVDKASDVLSEKFRQEILSNGNLYFFNDDQIIFIKCLNKNISKPDYYKCFQVNGKKE